MKILRLFNDTVSAEEVTELYRQFRPDVDSGKQIAFAGIMDSCSVSVESYNSTPNGHENKLSLPI
jgi:hypothetical protein